jgi:DNA topoisomerase-1
VPDDPRAVGLDDGPHRGRHGPVDALHVQGHRPHARLRRLLPRLGRADVERRADPAQARGEQGVARSISTRQQKFTSPPPRYTEASADQDARERGHRPPSTYASIIQVIQDRKYVEQIERRFYATDLGEVVTDKLIEASPSSWTSATPARWRRSSTRSRKSTSTGSRCSRTSTARSRNARVAEENSSTRRPRSSPRPRSTAARSAAATLVYRFGKNGRFLSCSTYPDCDYACPCDRQGKPRPAEFVNIKCPKTGAR